MSVAYGRVPMGQVFPRFSAAVKNESPSGSKCGKLFLLCEWTCEPIFLGGHS